MKKLTLLLLAGLLLAGCAKSTIETRKQERYGAYTALSADARKDVDKGQIKIGMTMDAVYIAWGKPAQVLTTQTQQGSVVTWLYHGSQLQEYHYWDNHHYGYRGCIYSQPWLRSGYYEEGYVSAEVVFENGLVKEWRTLPAPAS